LCLFDALDFQSRALAVGHNEDPEPSVRGSDIDGADRNGPGSITSISQLLHNARNPALGPGRDVFDDEPLRRDLVDDPEEVVEREAGAGLDAETLSEPGGGDVLASEPSAEDINAGRVRDRCDIREPHYVRKVVRKHARTERIDLALPGDSGRDAILHERSEHSELKTSDT